MCNEATVRADDEHMRRVRWLASRARGVGTGVGCVIVDGGGEIVGEGFNRLAAPVDGLPDDGTGRRFVVHAETTALLSASPGGVKAYCTLAPCFDCLKHLSFYGVQCVVYEAALGRNKDFSVEKTKLFRSFMERARIVVMNREHVPFLDDIEGKGLPCGG